MLTWLLRLCILAAIAPAERSVSEPTSASHGWCFLLLLLAVASISSTLKYIPVMQMAVLKETDGRGPFSSLTMAVVIVKDVVVFVCFAINIEMANVVRNLSQSYALGSLPCGTLPAHCPTGASRY